MTTEPTESMPSPEPGQGSSLRKPLLIGVSVVVVGVLAVGAWAGSKLIGGGTQPAEALPASVVAYASIDIDPGAKQKIEAIRTLRKFPELKKQLEVDEDDDLRRKIFTEAIKGSDCEGKVSFDKDVEPWLGQRAALGMADLDKDEPTPIFALQVSDEDDARNSIEKLRDCGAGEDEGTDEFSMAYNEGYLLLSEGADTADALAEAAATKSLADEDGFKEWTDKAGGDGIVNFYVSKRAAEMASDMMPPEVRNEAGDLTGALDEFEGMAGALRFADGGLELEIAAEGGEDFIAGTELGESLTGLPSDTAMALGFGVPEDFAENLAEQVEGTFGNDAESLFAEAESMTGLSFPEDLQTLLGEAVLLALGGDAPASGADLGSPADVPFGLKIIGDAEEIQGVVAKAEERSGQSVDDADLVQDVEGDAYVLASNDDFAQELKEGGDLGGNDNFAAVVPEAGKSSFAMFVDFDSAWLDTILETMRENGAPSDLVTKVDENVSPLAGFGMSAWRDGDVAHALVKITTD